MLGEPVYARADRVAEKLRAARERGCAPFGVESHGFRIHPPLPEREVAAFEVRHGVRLPEGYRAFVTRVGDGGAGPAYGMYGLEKALVAERHTVPDGFLRTPFDHTAAFQPSDDPVLDDLFDRIDRGELPRDAWKEHADMTAAGTLVLCHEGCGYLHLLAVTGPTRGEMWLDQQCSDGGLVPLRVDFLEWYERWLDDTLAGGRGTWWLNVPLEQAPRMVIPDGF